MPSRKPKIPTTAKKLPGSAPDLRQALARHKKADLVDILLELAQADRGLLRQLNARFDVVAAPTKLITETGQAIADATAFDPRKINDNFDDDDDAYREVKRNLTRLIALGQLRPAMQLALELMKQGSHQVEMSDEGMMTDDIEDCLSVVLKPLAKSDLPRPKSSPGARPCWTATAWASSPRSPWRRCKGTFNPERDSLAAMSPPRLPILPFKPQLLRPIPAHQAVRPCRPEALGIQSTAVEQIQIPQRPHLL